MKTFTSIPAGVGQGSSASTPPSTPGISKTMDVNTVYMFFEELKVAFEKGQAKQSDGSQVQTEVINPEIFGKILASQLPKLRINLEAPVLDYSKIPVSKDYSAEFKKIGEMVVKKDSETAKQLSTIGTSLRNLESAVSVEPKVQKVEKTIKFDINSWKSFMCMAASFIISLFLGVWILIQSNEMDNYKDTDLKYRLIQMNGSVSSVGLDSIEVWFQDPARIKNIRKMVTEHEQRMERLHRSTLERDRLNNEIDNLSSQSPHNPR